MLEAGPYLDRDDYPDEPLAALTALYRDGGLTVAEGRPAIPTPVGRAVGGTTVINSGHLLSHPRAGARALGRRARDRLGDASSTPTSPRPRRCSPCSRSTRSAWAATASSCCEGAEALGRQPRAAAPQRRRLRPVQLLPASAAGWTRSGRCTSPTCRARSPPGPGSEPASRRGGSSSSGGRAAGSNAAPASARPAASAASVRGAGTQGGGRSPAARSAPRSCCCARAFARRAASSAATCASTRPAGSAPASTRRCAAGRASCRATRSTSGRTGGVLLEATFTPLAFGGQWLPGTGAEHQRAAARLRQPRLDRRPPLRQARRAGRARLATARCGSPTSSPARTRERLVFGIARAAELFYAAGATRGLSADLRRRRRCRGADRRVRGLSPAPRARCAWRRFTRWAQRAWTATRAAA